MRTAGLFAGIGGLEKGLAAAGHETEFLCEVWEPARAVLEDHYPGVPCWRDVTNLRDLPESIELLVGGFPCQDLSQAGNTAGIEGLRSGLVGHVFRLLRQRKVPWVVLENVSFMLQLNRGKAMRTLVEAFEELGYRWAYRVVSSLSFLPQRRERVIFVATNTDADPADVILVDEANPPKSETALETHAHGFYWTEGIRGLGWAQDAIPTLKNGSTVGIPSSPAILLPDGQIITPDIRDAERLQGFSPDWTKAAEEVARASLRWTLVGNAVTPAVAHWLGGRVAAPGAYNRCRDVSLNTSGSWPKAGRYDGSKRHQVLINQFPAWVPRRHLADFLEFPGKPLSIRATRGFLERTERSCLRFPPGFQDAIRVHLARMEQTSTDEPQGKAVAA